MKSLSPEFKIKALKGLSTKQMSPNIKGVSAQLKRKVNPDYMPNRKRDLTSRLYK